MTAPLRVALLRRAFPDLAVLDRAVATGGLFPWWPGVVPMLPHDAILPPAERTLLEGFGLRDADPGDPGLVATEGEAAPWLAAGAMVLTAARDLPEAPRILLLTGAGGAVEQASLLLPEGALPGALAALAAAAEAMAGTGWEWAARPVTERLATLTLFAPALPPVTLPGAALPRWREAPGRLRVLLGALPVRPWRIAVRSEGATAMFLDGAPHDPAMPFTPQPGLPVVLGLAGDGAVLQAVEIAPA